MIFVQLTKAEFYMGPGTIMLTSQGKEMDGEDVSEETYQANFTIKMWTPFIVMEDKTFFEIYETGKRIINQVLGFGPSLECNAPDSTAAWYFKVDRFVFKIVFCDTGEACIECEQEEENLDQLEPIYRYLAKNLMQE